MTPRRQWSFCSSRGLTQPLSSWALTARNRASRALLLSSAWSGLLHSPSALPGCASADCCGCRRLILYLILHSSSQHESDSRHWDYAKHYNGADAAIRPLHRTTSAQQFMIAVSAAHAESAGEPRSEEAAFAAHRRFADHACGPIAHTEGSLQNHPECLLSCVANLILSCDLLLVISCSHILLLDLLDGHRAGRPCACFLGL